MARYLVSTDTGGTFVDAVIWDLNEGLFHVGKAAATVDDPPRGIIASVAAAAELAGLSLEAVLSDTALFFNGTTVTTNAMIERKGAPTGLLITAGFKDTLAIANVMGRTAGLDEAELLDFRNTDWPAPIVPRTLVRGIVERVDANGEVLVAFDPDQAARALDELVALKIEALAICFLWSFRTPDNERKMKALAAERYPDLFTVASSDLIPVLREFERANTTAINAYLGPVFEGYVHSLAGRLREERYPGEPLIMQSVGGLAPADEIKRAPITTLFSGPVGGVIAGQNLGAAIGEQNLITTDMGGTSFDVGMILEGEPLIAATTVIERQIVAIPTVEIVTVGAGGGSAAWINEVGILQVGPRSMGSMPGPACYGRGGDTPTVTDADVVLGYIDPDHFLGGRMEISRERAAEAIRMKIAEPLGMNVVEAAAAVYQIINARMADLIRRVTVQRGHDPRDFVIAAFGGCGPTHSTAYGADIGVRLVVVPDSATVFSAFGIGQSDLKHAWVRSFSHELRGLGGDVHTEPLDEINNIFAELTEQAHRQLRRDNVAAGAEQLRFSVDLRYRNQIHELVVPLPSAPPLATQTLGAIVGEFERCYDQRYGAGAASPTARIEWVNLRVDAVGPTPVSSELKAAPVGPPDPEVARLGEKETYNLRTGCLEPTPHFAAERLLPGHRIEGPAVFVSYGTTVPLHDGQLLAVDSYGNFLIEFSA